MAKCIELLNSLGAPWRMAALFALILVIVTVCGKAISAAISVSSRRERIIFLLFAPALSIETWRRSRAITFHDLGRLAVEIITTFPLLIAYYVYLRPLGFPDLRSLVDSFLFVYRTVPPRHNSDWNDGKGAVCIIRRPNSGPPSVPVAFPKRRRILGLAVELHSRRLDPSDMLQAVQATTANGGPCGVQRLGNRSRMVFELAVVLRLRFRYTWLNDALLCDSDGSGLSGAGTLLAIDPFGACVRLVCGSSPRTPGPERRCTTTVSLCRVGVRLVHETPVNSAEASERP